MGAKTKETLRVQFDKRLRLEFHGAKSTSDAGLLACRELDGALELTEAAPAYLEEAREGKNVQHKLGHRSLVMTRRYSNLSDIDVSNKHLQYSPGDRLNI